MSNQKIGFIGLGSLGEGLCNSLVTAGYPVTVNDLNKSLATRLLAAGATWADTTADACKDADVVITVLPSPAVSRKVVEGPGGVFDNLKAGGTWIEMSTTDQHEIERIASLAAARGIATLEAPVTGGVHRAAAGEITAPAAGFCAELVCVIATNARPTTQHTTFLRTNIPGTSAQRVFSEPSQGIRIASSQA